MRRIFKEKEADRSADKKKRDALMKSITTEGQNKKRLTDEVETIEKDMVALSSAREIEKKKTSELKTKRLQDEKKLKDLQEKIVPLQSQVAEEVDNLESLTERREDLENSYQKKSLTLHKNHQVFVNLQKKEVFEMNEEISDIEKNLTFKKKELLDATNAEDHVRTETESKKNEVVALEKTLVLRETELSDMEKERKRVEGDISDTKGKLNEIYTKLEDANSDLVGKEDDLSKTVKEVEKKEKEVAQKRDLMVALVKKEDRINKLIPDLKDLYAKAGINLKI